MDGVVAGIVAAGVAAVIVIGVVAVKDNNRQNEALASGKCKAKAEAVYSPPPTYLNVGSKDYPVMMPITSEPYMRTLWSCPDGYEFWRRS